MRGARPGVLAEHDFEATFGIGRRPLSARSGQMHRSKQHPRSQAGVWTSEAERRRPPSDLRNVAAGGALLR